MHVVRSPAVLQVFSCQLLTYEEFQHMKHNSKEHQGSLIPGNNWSIQIPEVFLQYKRNTTPKEVLLQHNGEKGLEAWCKDSSRTMEAIHVSLLRCPIIIGITPHLNRLVFNCKFAKGQLHPSWHCINKRELKSTHHTIGLSSEDQNNSLACS